jgi:23S rRNA-/tRNA-specific pseudouridylate synthase
MTQNAALAMTQNAALAMTQNAALAMTQNAALAMTAGFESRLRLHASALAFDHPVTGLKLRFDSLVPF